MIPEPQTQPNHKDDIASQLSVFYNGKLEHHLVRSEAFLTTRVVETRQSPPKMYESTTCASNAWKAYLVVDSYSSEEEVEEIARRKKLFPKFSLCSKLIC